MNLDNAGAQAAIALTKMGEAYMSEYLGQDVTINMLNAYASEARTTHNITIERLMALTHVTGDVRILAYMAAKMGCLIIGKDEEPYIEYGMVKEQQEALKKRERAIQSRLRRQK
ncbi:MAG: phage regulatory CII family protein [Pseudomonadota bacterium]